MGNINLSTSWKQLREQLNQQFNENKLLFILGILILAGVIATLGFTGSKLLGCGGSDEETMGDQNYPSTEGEQPASDLSMTTSTTSYGAVAIHIKYETSGTNYLMVVATDSSGNTVSDGTSISSTGSATLNLTLSMGSWNIVAYIYPSATATSSSDLIAQSSPQAYTISGNTTVNLTITYASSTGSYTFDLSAQVSVTGTTNYPPQITLDQSKVALSVNTYSDYIKVSIPSGALTVTDSEDGDLCGSQAGAYATVTCLLTSGSTVTPYSGITFSPWYSYSYSSSYNHCVKDVYLYNSLQYTTSSYSYSYSSSNTFSLSSATSCTIKITSTDSDGGTSSANLTINIPSDINSIFNSYSYSY